MKKLWKFFLDNQMVASLIIGIFFSGLTLIYTETRYQTYSQKVENAQREAQHTTLNGFAFGIGSLKQSATTLESGLIETRQTNRMLVQCIQNGNCKNFPELLTEKEMPKYESPSEIYKDIESKMTKEFEKLE